MAENNESSRQGEAEPLSPPDAPEPLPIFLNQSRISQTLGWLEEITENSNDSVLAHVDGKLTTMQKELLFTPQQQQPESTIVYALTGSEENIKNMLHAAEMYGVPGRGLPFRPFVQLLQVLIFPTYTKLLVKSLQSLPSIEDGGGQLVNWWFQHRNKRATYEEMARSER
ncbi:uncharacterized protein LOC132797791 [Drosophila nasuta]|uniref:uncharacterized protein LOC132797791 n=1 Tax=Drosophila nasuta TaxID=42062 RepID=UPI00295ECE6A|nr:uncharacterized protein LOC132797791 [Drosophila nasuta]